MCNVFEIAQAKRASIIAEIAKIDQYINLHQQLFGDEQPEPTDTARKKSGKGAGMAAAIERVLRYADRPMHRGEIRKAMEAAGYQIPAQDKSKYVTVSLWRYRDKFKSVDGGYILKGSALDSSDEEERSDDTGTAEQPELA